MFVDVKTLTNVTASDVLITCLAILTLDKFPKLCKITLLNLGLSYNYYSSNWEYYGIVLNES